MVAADAPSSSQRSVLVAYGSETGNAQDMAEEVGRLCQRLHFRCDVEELDAVDLPALLRPQLVIFVISTTGQGDMPHNSLFFWKRLLRKKLPPGCLSQLRYTCLGLGDSTYIKFNWAARKMIRRLEQLGGETFLEPGEADEQQDDGIEAAFELWTGSLRKHLIEQHPLPDSLQPIPDDEILPPRWSLEPALQQLPNGIENGISSLALNGHQAAAAAEDHQPPPPLVEDLPPAQLLPVPDAWAATLAENTRLTPDTHWQDVRLVKLDIPGRHRPDSAAPSERLHCNPGDCITIYPKNFPNDAQKLISLMHWDRIADQPLELSVCDSLPRGLHAAASSSTHSHPTLRDLLLNNIDITALPRRSFLKNMSYFATDPDHKERLIEFTQPQYLDEYFDYVTRSRRSIIEVLEEFTSVQIPPSLVLDIFPLIRGRDFSVANGGAALAHPTDPSLTRVELLVALVRYRTVLRKPREGLCSRYLASLIPGRSVISVTRKPVLSPIHGAANARRPLVAMATGTGLAPVRCLIQERLTHPDRGPMLLFFGNRNRAADYFFEEEWAVLAETPRDGQEEKDAHAASLSVFTAFSRDQRQKIYIQDRIREKAALLAPLVPQHAIFTVCGGSSKMADACKAAVFDPFIAGGGGGQQDGGEQVGEREEENGAAAAVAAREEARRKTLDRVTWWQEIW